MASACSVTSTVARGVSIVTPASVCDLPGAGGRSRGLAVRAGHGVSFFRAPDVAVPRLCSVAVAKGVFVPSAPSITSGPSVSAGTGWVSPGQLQVGVAVTVSVSVAVARSVRAGEGVGRRTTGAEGGRSVVVDWRPGQAHQTPPARASSTTAAKNGLSPDHQAKPAGRRDASAACMRSAHGALDRWSTGSARVVPANARR